MNKKFLITSLLFSMSVSSNSLTQRAFTQFQNNQDLGKKYKSIISNKGGANVVTVGSDLNCDFRVGATKIQDAIDSNPDEVRIAMNDTYNENLTIADKSISLRGGFANCTDAENDVQTSSHTEIRGVDAAGLPVIAVTGASQNNTITIQNIDLTNGTGTFLLPAGGISATAADAFIILTDVDITGNNGGLGGGVAILGGNTNVWAIDVRIDSNTADSGGGVYCDGPNASFLLDGESSISVNAADNGQGGGVFLTNQCSFTSYAGAEIIEFFDIGGIALNTATEEGGGIYAQSGAIATLYGHQFTGFFTFGNNTDPVKLNLNQSDVDSSGNEGGGGAYITGADTELNIYAGQVSFNFSGSTGGGDGGAIYVADQATFTSGRLFKECWDTYECNVFANNTTGENDGRGGAIYNNAGTVDVYLSHFKNNLADLGVAVYSIGAGSSNRLEGNVFHSNGDNGVGDFSSTSLIRSITDATYNIFNNTMADNNITGQILAVSNTSGQFNLFSSIIHDSADAMSATTASTIIDCVMAHETSSFPGSSTNIVLDDPEFVNRANDDYHINPDTSPAIDLCGGFITGIHPDLDFEARGFDDPRISNVGGSYDAGADEATDVIFEQDFDPS